MTEALIPGKQEAQSYEGKLPKVQLSPDAKKPIPLPKLLFGRKILIPSAALLAIACNVFNNAEQQTVPPPTPIPAASELQTETPTPTATPTETPTPKPKVISMGGSVETDPANPSVETIKLLFPEGIIDGKSPLIPQKDTLSVSVKFNSDSRINQLSLSLSDLLGMRNNKFSMGMSVANERDTVNITSDIGIFQRSAKFSISDADQEVINKITLSTVRHSNKDLVVILSLPNESFTYIDKDGSHLVNPAERFASGEVGIGIKRKDRLALTVENINIANSKGKLVATANRFDITPQPTRTIPTETPTRSPTPTPTPEPKPAPEPTPTPTSTPIPTPTPEPPPTPAQVPKIELKPREKLNWVQRIENKFEPKKRSIDLEFQGGDKGNLIIEIRVPLISKEVMSEGSVLNIPHNGADAYITVIIPPGAPPICFDKIFFNVSTREEGTQGGRLARVLLAQNVCIVESLHPSISSHYLDRSHVISYVDIFNSAVDQKTGYAMENCNFQTAERERQIWKGTERIFSPDQPRTIPSGRTVRYVVYSTLTDDNVPIDLPKCDVKTVNRVLEK